MMSVYELIIISCSVSLDAFAVAVCCGIRVRGHLFRTALTTGILFGGFQFFMPLLGWIVGRGFGSLIKPVDHWFAFGLLCAVGGKMIRDATRHEDAPDTPVKSGNLPFLSMLTAALATSLDALGVGVSYGVLSFPVALTAVMMGLFTLLFSFSGVIIGSRVGHLFERKVEIVGGVTVILIGVKILVEHLLSA